jgi:hypothetical protein
MANPNALVAIPTAVARDESGHTVELGDRTVRLEADDPRAQILEGLSKLRSPAYVELDPEGSTITRLLIPLVSTIVNVALIDHDVLGVELSRSHARHVLRRGAPDFDELESRLREALRTDSPVIVTETDDHEIIDVRPYRPGSEGPPQPIPFPKREPRPAPRDWPWRPLRELLRLPPCLCCLWRWCRCLSATRAQHVFDAMSATTCAPLTVPPPCIPFMYPDDGCWARASEMCRLMINMGLTPRKVWIQGSLVADTRNNPSCHVFWGWHVAPTLCVRTGFCRTDVMVIDPSLFTTPVTKATWKGVQGDPSATLTDTDASDYLWGATDPTYSQTNADLAFYRLQLQNRSIAQGPPPYASCP